MQQVIGDSKSYPQCPDPGKFVPQDRKYKRRECRQKTGTPPLITIQLQTKLPLQPGIFAFDDMPDGFIPIGVRGRGFHFSRGFTFTNTPLVLVMYRTAMRSQYVKKKGTLKPGPGCL